MFCCEAVDGCWAGLKLAARLGSTVGPGPEGPLTSGLPTIPEDGAASLGAACLSSPALPGPYVASLSALPSRPSCVGSLPVLPRCLLGFISSFSSQLCWILSI